MPCFRVRCVIVFGGSAGGIESLSSILAGLPPELPCAALAVIHTSEKSKYLPEVLKRFSHLDVVCPDTAAPLKQGRVYIAGPNRHLIVKSHCAVSWMGPRENRHRPAVDTLFRSAARAYRSHVIAVVLSGALAVKSRGGTVIVQDPREATIHDMPANVLRQVETDYCVPLAKIPSLLVKLAADRRPMKIPVREAKQCMSVAEPGLHEKEPTGITCPECGGALMEIKDRKNVQFRCHVGHTFSLESLTEVHADALERGLWVALRRLNEQRSLHESLARNHRGDPSMKRRYQENAAAAAHDIKLLHEIIARL